MNDIKNNFLKDFPIRDRDECYKYLDDLFDKLNLDLPDKFILSDVLKAHNDCKEFCYTYHDRVCKKIRYQSMIKGITPLCSPCPLYNICGSSENKTIFHYKFCLIYRELAVILKDKKGISDEQRETIINLLIEMKNTHNLSKTEVRDLLKCQ